MEGLLLFNKAVTKWKKTKNKKQPQDFLMQETNQSLTLI